jgi:hypothetical protein
MCVPIYEPGHQYSAGAFHDFIARLYCDRRPNGGDCSGCYSKIRWTSNASRKKVAMEEYNHKGHEGHEET